MLYRTCDDLRRQINNQSSSSSSSGLPGRSKTSPLSPQHISSPQPQHASMLPLPLRSGGDGVVGITQPSGKGTTVPAATAGSPTSTHMLNPFLNPFLSNPSASTRTTVSNPFASNPFAPNPFVSTMLDSNPIMPNPFAANVGQQRSPSKLPPQSPPQSPSDINMLAHLDQRLEMHDRLQKEQEASVRKSSTSRQSPQAPTPPQRPQQQHQQPQQQHQQPQQQQPQPQQSEENNEDGDVDGDAVHLLPLRETSSWPLHTNILVPLFAKVEAPIAYQTRPSSLPQSPSKSHPRPQLQSQEQEQPQTQPSPLSSPSKLMAFIRKHSM